MITESLVLECEVVGSTRPLVTWYRDTQIISAESMPRVSIQETNGTGNTIVSRLEIQSVQLSDEAVYRCQAEDSDSVNSTETILIVLGNRSMHEFNIVQSSANTFPCT